MESQLVLATKDVYRFFAGLAEFNQVEQSFGYLFNDESPQISLSERDLLLSNLKKHPAIISVINKWQNVMSGSTPLSHDKASELLRQLFSSVERDERLFSYKNTACHERSIANTWRDFHVCRPEPKAGWTIHITRKGSGTYNFVRSTLETEPGDILLFSPSAYLECHLAESCEEWQYSWIMFQPDEQNSQLLNWPKVAAGIYHIKAKSSQELENITSVIDLLVNQGHSTDPCEVRIRSTCVEHILLRCNQLLESVEYHQMDNRILAAIDFMEKNICSDLTIEQVADAACLSISGLSKLFKKHCGVSAMQWREERRMTAACHQLIHTNNRIIQIAEDLGYVNQMYFSRCFSKQMKMSPSEYRKLHSNHG